MKCTLLFIALIAGNAAAFMAPLNSGAVHSKQMRAQSQATVAHLFGGAGEKTDGPAPGGAGMDDKIKKAQEIAQKTQTMQKELAEMEVEGVSSCGKVTVTVSGQQVPKKCDVSEELLAEGKAAVDAAITSAWAVAHENSLKAMTKNLESLYTSLGVPPNPLAK
eukprot:CAMPEP_0113936902 /NCGR_PEP_ID=MMETSP1339-20121228/3651_1 /TAXON_ID=94617 /ORGANISM="Fibrocapsa japonica" /LENGTH=162 /DNA_ID=CAMNT_0000939475 /DNA_START=59 /DNA_END=547 /DNA_ORIENTATION=- /assembly_acc=CAM_ASM_000762